MFQRAFINKRGFQYNLLLCFLLSLLSTFYISPYSHIFISSHVHYHCKLHILLDETVLLAIVKILKRAGAVVVTVALMAASRAAAKGSRSA